VSGKLDIRVFEASPADRMSTLSTRFETEEFLEKVELPVVVH
jgi:hypothetical protein